MYKLFFKRFVDIVLSLIALIMVFPLLLLAYICIKLDSKGPFFFFQERLGYQGKVFKVFKLRTMTDKPRVADREVLKGDAEVTKVGAFLRRFKIDELPQLINILKGDMSIVGPRPGLPRQLEEFNEDGRKRICVRPGLTGLAQVNGNIHLPWPERWKYDRQYVEQLNFLLDVKIILKTVLIVLLGEDKFLKNLDAQNSISRISNQ